MNLFYRSIIKFARYKMQPKNYSSFKMPNDLIEEVDLFYLNDDNQNHLLDIYYPREIEGLLPVIVDVHGGAWIYGDKEVNKAFAVNFAKKGYAVVNINYTLMPHATLKQQVQEIFAVLAFIEKSGQHHHLDCKRVILLGDSAGAHLSGLVYAIMNQIDLCKIYQVTPPKVTIKALCLIHGVSDLSFLSDSRNFIYQKTSVMLQGENSDKSCTYKKACLADLIHNCPCIPVMLVSSQKDRLHFQSIKIKEILKSYNWEVETLFWPNEKHLEHVFVVLHPEYPESQSTVDKICEFINKQVL